MNVCWACVEWDVIGAWGSEKVTGGGEKKIVKWEKKSGIVGIELPRLRITIGCSDHQRAGAYSQIDI